MKTETSKSLFTAEEVRLVRQQGNVLIESYQSFYWIAGQRRPVRSEEQPREWHDGHKLLLLAQKLDRFRRRHETRRT